MRRMRAKAKRLFALGIATAALLSGCSQAVPFAGGNVEELLRAPQPGAQQSAVQKALNAYQGETVQLKYPRGGSEMSPMLFADLDGDGTEEAMVLYQTQRKGQNVHMAVLENTAAGWLVAYEIEGLSTEVACVERTQMTGSGIQLIVGYANATLSDKYLSVYDYHDETVTRLYEQSYTQYLAADIDADSLCELLVVPPSTLPGALTLQLLAPGENGLRPVQSLPLDERFVSCKGLYASQSGRRRGVVLDGTFSSGGLASQVLRLTEAGQLTQWPADEETDVPRQSLRYLTDLHAADLNGQGAVHVPTGVSSVPTLTSSRRFYFVTWKDFLAQDEEEEAASAATQQPEDSNAVQAPAAAQGTSLTQAGLPEGAQFGVFDTSYGYFLRLPDSWSGTVNLVDGLAPGEWCLRTKEGNTLLMTARVADAAKPLGRYTTIATAGDNYVQVYFTESCPVADARLIRKGAAVL